MNTNKMTAKITDISQRKAAIVAGVAFLIYLIPAIFGNFFIFGRLIVPGDAATTANNIMASEGLFRVGIVIWLIVLACDVVFAWALYVFFKQVNKSLSLLAAWFRLVGIAIFGITLLNLFFILQLLSGADYLTVFGTGQLHALVLLFLKGYDYGFLIALFFMSFLNLFFLGYLVFQSGYIPRILGFLLIIASCGYLIDSVGKFLFSNYPEIISLVVTAPNFIGETAIVVWLLIKGGKTSEMKS